MREEAVMEETLLRLLREKHDELVREIRSKKSSFVSPWQTNEEVEKEKTK
jgi:hypothetical protein